MACDEFCDAFYLDYPDKARMLATSTRRHF
jgi:hypothetical protein